MSTFRVVFLFLCSLLIQDTIAGDNAASKNPLYSRYPAPPQNDRSLFFVQRSKNTNAIVYETNVLPSGKINTDDPLKIYWMQYASDSSKEDLNYVQRRYAYGIQTTAVKGHPGQYMLNFVSYEKKKFFLIGDSEGKRYKAFMTINGLLNSAFGSNKYLYVTSTRLLYVPRFSAIVIILGLKSPIHCISKSS